MNWLPDLLQPELVPAEIEPELNQPLPRRVAMKEEAYGPFLSCAGVLILALAFAFAFWRMWREDPESLGDSWPVPLLLSVFLGWIAIDNIVSVTAQVRNGYRMARWGEAYRMPVRRSRIESAGKHTYRQILVLKWPGAPTLPVEVILPDNARPFMFDGGDIATVLCDDADPEAFVIYQHCWFRAVVEPPPPWETP